MGRVSRKFDSFLGNKKIEAQKFFSQLRDASSADQAEAKKIMLILDTNAYGHTDVTEFLVAIHGTLGRKEKGKS